LWKAQCEEGKTQWRLGSYIGHKESPNHFPRTWGHATNSFPDVIEVCAWRSQNASVTRNPHNLKRQVNHECDGDKQSANQSVRTFHWSSKLELVPSGVRDIDGAGTSPDPQGFEFDGNVVWRHGSTVPVGKVVKVRKCT
jgi:hypothetical protein